MTMSKIKDKVIDDMNNGYRQMIHIEGKSIDDIFRLPCVRCICKTIFGSIVYDLYKFIVAEGSETTAGDGDWLCELYDGKWVVEKNTPE